MSTVVKQVFVNANIADIAQFISGMDFPSTDFSVDGVYDFIANSKTKLRLRMNSSNPALYVVFNGTEGTAFVSGSTLSARILKTENGNVLSIAATNGELTPSTALNIILAPATSTYDNSSGNVLITTASSTGGTKMYAHDTAAAPSSAEAPATPIVNSLNTVLYKYCYSTSYFIPDGVYGIRNTNVTLTAGYYRLTLNDVPYETIGYLALKDE